MTKLSTLNKTDAHKALAALAQKQQAQATQLAPNGEAFFASLLDSNSQPAAPDTRDEPKDKPLAKNDQDERAPDRDKSRVRTANQSAPEAVAVPQPQPQPQPTSTQAKAHDAKPKDDTAVAAKTAAKVKPAKDADRGDAAAVPAAPATGEAKPAQAPTVTAAPQAASATDQPAQPAPDAVAAAAATAVPATVAPAPATQPLQASAGEAPAAAQTQAAMPAAAATPAGTALSVPQTTPAAAAAAPQAKDATMAPQAAPLTNAAEAAQPALPNPTLPQDAAATPARAPLPAAEVSLQAAAPVTPEQAVKGLTKILSGMTAATAAPAAPRTAATKPSAATITSAPQTAAAQTPAMPAADPQAAAKTDPQPAVTAGDLKPTGALAAAEADGRAPNINAQINTQLNAPTVAVTPTAQPQTTPQNPALQTAAAQAAAAQAAAAPIDPNAPAAEAGAAFQPLDTAETVGGSALQAPGGMLRYEAGSLTNLGRASRAGLMTSDPALPANLQVAVQLARAAKSGQGAGTRTLNIQLAPAELGRVEVKLEVDARGTASARIVVDSPSTLDLLQQNRSGLERALTDAGLQPGTLTFDLRDGGQGNGGFGQQAGLQDEAQGQNRGNRQAPNAPAGTNDATPTTNVTLNLAALPGRVDIRA